ncbi:hypothetical protein CH380_09775 [Leptospira adleri]|uniref:Uncharacterized protein n=1 Tax=Leptospira adleri TaxID=2023186 RepID=A0A2M9YPI8_9LEPT|nr:hypothetical protein CH380_09775 [Leptospira adleri]PJZ63049.1 hypothetical protein CH376_05135 [Leptospira adleri]
MELELFSFSVGFVENCKVRISNFQFSNKDKPNTEPTLQQELEFLNRFYRLPFSKDLIFIFR